MRARSSANTTQLLEKEGEAEDEEGADLEAQREPRAVGATGAARPDEAVKAGVAVKAEEEEGPDEEEDLHGGVTFGVRVEEEAVKEGVAVEAKDEEGPDEVEDLHEGITFGVRVEEEAVKEGVAVVAKGEA